MKRNISGQFIMRVRFCLLLTVWLLMSLNVSQAQDDTSSFRSRADNPRVLRNYVVDETGTLTNSQVNALSEKLRQVEEQTSNQIVVYMIPSLGGDALEDLSIRIAEKNKIGKKDRNNGVLLLIVKNDRKLRIEVGYGLEGALTDAASSSIIRNDIAPNFKRGNYYEGINAGVDAIIAVTKGEYTADKREQKGSGACGGIPIFVLLIFAIIFFFIFTSIIRHSLGRGKNLYGSKSGWSAIPWIISSGSGSKGSWGSGSSGGFGGFSGGGGSFGGGGASGSW
jgi:uncharacterized protein